MNAQQLRNSILQEAIHGRLVPQDPADEPASVLLQRIRKEKERLVMEGKLKKKDLESKPIEDDEIPFGIPKGWEWCVIGDLFAHNNGKQLNKGNAHGKMMDYITTSNLYWEGFSLDKIKQMPFEENEIERCQAIKGDLLVCEGGDIGRAAIWNYENPIMLQNHLHKLRSYIPLCTEYFYYIFYYYNKLGMIGGKGIGIQGFSSTALHNTKVPLPPLPEQHRIVAKIEELLPLVEQYGKAQAELEDLNRSLPDKLKKSVLQEAIQGRLVPQDANDEPASELLKRIRKEKERLVKEGKLKKKDLESKPIGDDEIPFEIPESWEWVRLESIVSILGDGIHGTPEYSVAGDYYFINGNNLDNGKIVFKENTKKVDYTQFEKYKKDLNETTILVSINGTIGNIAFYNNEKVILGKSACYFNLIFQELKQFIYKLLGTDYFLKYALKKATGSTIKNVSLKAMSSFLIPLPPLAEQRRIVAKIEELFKKIDGLKV